MTTYLKGSVQVYIARENVEDNAYGGTYESSLAQDGNQIYASVATRKLYLIPGVTGVTINNFGLEFDTFQTLNDDFDHDIEIKENGSGSCDFIFEYGRTTGAAGIAHEELKALAYYYPNGWNEIDTNVAVFDPTQDIFTTRATDTRGYCIIVAQAVGDGNNLYWCFDNCKISCSVNFASKQASRASFTWDDARYVSFDESADEIVAATDVHDDGYAKGWN